MANSPKIRQTVRIPFAPIYSNRDGKSSIDNQDQHFVNCILDIKQDPYTKEETTYALKRPGVGAMQDFTNIPDAGTGSFSTQGFWIFHNKAVFVNNNRLYTCAVPVVTETPTLLHTFNAYTLENTAAVEIWNEFGTDFSNDFIYRGTELLQEGIEYLYITNGLEDILIDKNSTVTSGTQAFNPFVASTYYKSGDRVIPSTYAGRTGYYYIVVGEAGDVTLSGTEPTWPTVLGSTVVSGDVTFMCFAIATASTVADIYTNRVYALNDLVQPSVTSGYYYKCTTAGTTTAEPTWSQIIGDTSSDSGVDFICVGNHGGKPGLALPMPVYLDTYLVLCPYKSSDLYNSGPSNIYSWNATDFISADSFTSSLKAVSRYNNYIIAYSDRDAELFYNNANTTGSPFSRHESFLLQVGTTTAYSVVGTESFICWAGESNAGSASIWMLDGFEPKEISTPFINKILATENIISSFAMRVMGHLLLVFNATSFSFVFDVGLNLWYEWSTDDSNFGFDFFAFDPQATVTSNTFLMSKTRNEVFITGSYLLSDYFTTVDTGTAIKVKLITSKIDFGNRYRKFGHSLDVIGDIYDPRNSFVSSPDANIDIYFSDNDYENITPDNLFLYPENAIAHTVDMSVRPRIAPIGSFRRRAFMLIYEGNLAFRLEGFDLKFTQGIS